MTHIVGLRLTNYQCFRGTTELDLGPGIYAVTAELNGNVERSNYLGKSALLTAIRYVLYGFKPKHFDSLDAMISEGEQQLGVDVELSDGTFASRTKKRGKGTEMRVLLPYDAPDRVDARELELFGDEAERQLWQRLGLTADDLELTAFAAQHHLADLVASESRVNIGDAVTTWLELSKLEVATDRAGAILRQESTTLRLTERKLVDVTEELKGLERPSDEQLLELEQQEADYRKLAERRADVLRRHVAWQHQGAARIVAIAQVVEALAVFAHFCTLLPAMDDGGALSRARTELGGKLAVARQNQADAQRLSTQGFDGNCPVNSMKCPVTATINADRLRNQTKLKAAIKLVNEARAHEKYAIERYEAWASVQRTYDDTRRKVERLANDLHHLSILEEVRAPEPDTSLLVEAVPPYVELQTLRAQRTRYEALRRQEMELWAEQDEQSKAASAARAALAVLEQAHRRVAERSISQIDRAANHDLAQAGIADLALEFLWQRETQKPAEQCSSCGSAFPRSTTIKQCANCLAQRGLKTEHKPRFRLSRVSGAAEALAGLAVRCAAFRWLRTRRGTQWSTAVLDEPFGTLDTYNRRALSTHVQRLLSGTFEQAFVTAHDRLVLDAMPRRILITSDGKWATAKVVG